MSTWVKEGRGMNVFILCTGRCGSTTFIKACRHISNFSSAHESRRGLTGDAHFSYPGNHIEADNRLSFFFGKLDQLYGNRAAYIHLKRNSAEVARSFAGRWSHGIMKAYREGMLTNVAAELEPLPVARDYCDTVSSNIALFLKDKTCKMEFNLEDAKNDFVRFWQFIGAEGNLEAALSEFNLSYNASAPVVEMKTPLAARIFRKMKRVVTKLPHFLKNA